MGNCAYFSKVWDVFCRSKTSPTIFLCAGIKLLSLQFLLEQEQSSQPQLFFFLSNYEPSVVIDFTVDPVWGTACLPCESEHFSAIPVPKSCISLCQQVSKFLKYHEVVLQSYTANHLCCLVIWRQACVKPDSVHPSAVCLNRLVSAVTESMCADKWPGGQMYVQNCW